MKRRLLVAVVVMAVAGMTHLGAFASSGSVNPTQVSTDGTRVRVSWSGMTAGSSIWIQQCDNVTGIAYDQSTDCSQLSATEHQGQYNANGSGSTGTTGVSTGGNPDFAVFVGAEKSGDLGWGCSKDGTAAGTMVGTVKMYNPCRIRVSESTVQNTTNEFFITITFIPVPPPRLPTSITATPAIAHVTAGKIYFPNLTATLTSQGSPVGGKLVSMKAGTAVVCSAVTNASGVASCGGVVQELKVILKTGYTAVFAGDAGYFGSTSKKAPLIIV